MLGHFLWDSLGTSKQCQLRAWHSWLYDWTIRIQTGAGLQLPRNCHCYESAISTICHTRHIWKNVYRGINKRSKWSWDIQCGDIERIRSARDRWLFYASELNYLIPVFSEPLHSDLIQHSRGSIWASRLHAWLTRLHFWQLWLWASTRLWLCRDSISVEFATISICYSRYSRTILHTFWVFWSWTDRNLQHRDNKRVHPARYHWQLRACHPNNRLHSDRSTMHSDVLRHSITRDWPTHIHPRPAGFWLWQLRLRASTWLRLRWDHHRLESTRSTLCDP